MQLKIQLRVTNTSKFNSLHHITFKSHKYNRSIKHKHYYSLVGRNITSLESELVSNRLVDNCQLIKI